MCPSGKASFYFSLTRVRDQSHVIIDAFCLTKLVVTRIEISINSHVVLWCIHYLQLLLLEHVRSGGVEYVVSELSLAIYVDRCCGFTGQEAVVDLPGTLRELEERSWYR